MKKLLTVVLAAALVLALTVPAMATTSGTYEVMTTTSGGKAIFEAQEATESYTGLEVAIADKTLHRSINTPTANAEIEKARVYYAHSIERKVEQMTKIPTFFADIGGIPCPACQKSLKVAARHPSQTIGIGA